jgi:hypothetical protein
LNTFKYIKREHSMYNNDTTIVVSYLVYLLISITLTVWVARTLHKRGGNLSGRCISGQC